MAKRPRNSAKAIIIRNDRLLVIRKKRGTDEWLLLPGGGQHHGESLHEALVRECFEELNALVIPGDLIGVREYRSWNHEFAEDGVLFHQVDFYFHARLKAGEKPGLGPTLDRNQVSVEWIPLKDLPRAPLYPKSLRKFFANIHRVKHRYFGDIN